MKQRLLSLMVALSFVLAMAFPVYAVEIPSEGTDLSGAIVIIHTNDSHGRMATDDSGKQAGFAAISGLKKAYEETGATVLLLDAGDTLHGLPVATINRGADVVTVLNAVGYEAMVPGNHDFNYGTPRLVELAAQMNFPLISANTISESTGQPVFDASVVIEKDGMKFGIFGLSTPETAYKTNPKNVEGIVFESPITHAQAQVATLQEQEVDCIIALGHIGVDAASEFTADKVAAGAPGIDIFIDGHSHTAMVNGKPVDPSITLVEHGDTLIASTGEYIENIGVIVITEDGVDAGLIPYSESIPLDAAITATLESISAQQDVVLSQVIGSTSVLLNGEREFNRKEETNLGNLAADAFRAATNADMAFTNGGGIRASIEAGDITKKDLVTVFPFGNYVVTKNVTGAAILAAMEHGVKDYPELSGGFPQVSGITFELNPAMPAGSRVLNAKIGGEDVDPAATYLMATNDFIAAGGDDYVMFSDFAIANEFGAMEEILIEYIQANPDKVAEVEGRITVAGDGETPAEAPVEETEEAPEVPAEETPEPVAEEPPAQEEAPEPVVEEPVVQPVAGTTVHIVINGDNLWKIARQYTGNGDNWPQIYELNKDTIANPNRIYIGQEILVPQN